MYIALLSYILLASALVNHAACLCGDSIKWSHTVNMVDVFGGWYGVGHAQHNTDRTNVPNEVGCISLYITDVNEYEDSWIDWSFPRMNYSSRNWQSSSSSWSENDMAGSWSNVRLKREVQRSLDGHKRIRVLWDQDGFSLEQVYIYYDEEPGLWTADLLWPSQWELIGESYPEEPPSYPNVIRILQLTSNMLVLNYCSEVENSGVFTLILRRSPAIVQRWEWYQYERQLYTFDLPTVYRFNAICVACTGTSSIGVVLFCFVSLFLTI